MIKLAEWQHALISLLILLLLISLVYFSAVLPLKTLYTEKAEQLSEKQTHLARFQSVASQKDRLIPFYEEQLQRVESNTALMPPMAGSLAAAKLQEQVKQILQRTSGQLLSTQAIPATQEGVFTPVKIRVHMKSDLETLLSTLHRLESGTPLGFVENLQIQLTGRQRNQRKPTSNNNTLDSRFDLKVFMQEEGS